MLNDGTTTSNTFTTNNSWKPNHEKQVGAQSCLFPLSVNNVNKQSPRRRTSPVNRLTTMQLRLAKTGLIRDITSVPMSWCKGNKTEAAKSCEKPHARVHVHINWALNFNLFSNKDWPARRGGILDICKRQSRAWWRQEHFTHFNHGTLNLKIDDHCLSCVELGRNRRVSSSLLLNVQQASPAQAASRQSEPWQDQCYHTPICLHSFNSQKWSPGFMIYSCDTW